MANNHYKDNKDQRLYHIEGLNKDLPSVTTILGLLDKSGPLLGWGVKVTIEYLQQHPEELRENPTETFKKAKLYYRELKEKATELGSEVHNLLEVFLKGQNITGLLVANPKLKPAFEAFLLWQKKYKFELVEAEHIIWSDLGYAGTLDCVARLDGKLYVIDFKSSKAIYDEYELQVAAYAAAYEERSEKEVEGIGILRLGKENGLPEWREIPLVNRHDLMDMFMALCHYWHIRQRRKDGHQDRKTDK